jgi:hypothetical protein
VESKGDSSLHTERSQPAVIKTTAHKAGKSPAPDMNLWKLLIKALSVEEKL